MRFVRTGFLLAVPAMVILLAACGPSDPAERVLAERARWSVSLQRWFPQDDGVFLALRVQNPRDATLETLTVQVLFLDTDDATVDERWVALPVSGIRSGASVDVTRTIPAPAAPFDSVAVILVTSPDDAQRDRIVELGQS